MCARFTNVLIRNFPFELQKEIQITKNLNHDNIVTFCTSFVVDDDLWLVTKYLDGGWLKHGSVESFVQQNQENCFFFYSLQGSLLDTISFRMRAMDCKNGVLDEITIATVSREVLKGLEYCHENGHIHRFIIRVHAEHLYFNYLFKFLSIFEET